jgi:hypothetical protein
MDSVSILRSPENVRILVAGGVGGLSLRLMERVLGVELGRGGGH